MSKIVYKKLLNSFFSDKKNKKTKIILETGFFVEIALIIVIALSYTTALHAFIKITYIH
jgi:hypothetical protein